MVGSNKLGQLAHNLIGLCLQLVVENELALRRDFDQVACKLYAFLGGDAETLKLLLELSDAHLGIHLLSLIVKEERRHVAGDELHLLQKKLE